MEDFDPLDTSPQDDKRAAEAERLELLRQRHIADFLWLMNDPAGRRIVWRMLADGGVFQSTFDTNAMLMAFNEGRRSEGLRMLAQVHELCPELYPTMMKENAP